MTRRYGIDTSVLVRITQSSPARLLVRRPVRLPTHMRTA